MMENKYRKINYIGWLGYSNLGDEGLYEINKKIFSPYKILPTLNNQHSTITLFGGGTLFPHWTWYVKPNKYNYAYGVGVKDPTFWGEWHKVMIKQIKNFNFRYLGVRGNYSKKTLESWGIKSTVIGDPCLLYKPTSLTEQYEEKIAINVGGSKGIIWGGNEKQVYGDIVKFCIRLKEKGYDPLLIPFWKDDYSTILEISKLANVEIFNDWQDIQKVIDVISSCKVMIGLKLHSIVFSASAYTPFISLEYRPKCRDFAETMGFENFTIRTDKLSAEILTIKFEEVLNNYNELKKELISNVEIYRDKLNNFSKKIKEDISNIPEYKLKPSIFDKLNNYSNFHERLYIRYLLRKKSKLRQMKER